MTLMFGVSSPAFVIRVKRNDQPMFRKMSLGLLHISAFHDRLDRRLTPLELNNHDPSVLTQ